ncbi:hypothetical protein QYF36_007744 [Acer negundo]|nr:hypothetical protein QYF36_007744 [Acer negundo]
MDSSQRQLCFDELQLQLANMESPLRQHFQPTPQQIKFIEPPLQQTNMEPSSQKQLSVNEPQLKRGGQLPKKFRAILPAPVWSQPQPQRPFHYPPLTINEDKAVG